MSHFISTSGAKVTDTVYFVIHRKASLLGALLPHRIFINGQFAGMLRSGKTICAAVPRGNAYYVEDDESAGNAVVCDNGQSEHRLLMKTSYRHTPFRSEFYFESGKEPEKLPMFHFERFLQADAALTPDEQVLALCLECAWSIGEDVLSSDSLFDIIDALQVIGATQYATLILEIIQRDFCGVQFPLNEAQMTQMQAKLDRAEQKIGDAPGAYDELRKAMARYMMARLNTSENIY